MTDSTRLTGEVSARLEAAARLLTAAAGQDWDADDAVATAIELARRAIAILDGTDEHVR